jgi:hypothetical protein
MDTTQGMYICNKSAANHMSCCRDQLQNHQIACQGCIGKPCKFAFSPAGSPALFDQLQGSCAASRCSIWHQWMPNSGKFNHKNATAVLLRYVPAAGPAFWVIEATVT